MLARLLVIDTETGGLDPANYSILSIGAVVWENSQIIGETSILIAEAEIKTDAESLAINRINIDSHKQNALSVPAAIARLFEFLGEFFPDMSTEKITLAGHNISFDVGFLKRLLLLGDYRYEKYFSHRTVDTSAIVRFLIMSGLLTLGTADSSTAFDYFGIKIARGERHTALGDARATALLLSAMINFVRSPRT